MPSLINDANQLINLQTERKQYCYFYLGNAAVCLLLYGVMNFPTDTYKYQRLKRSGGPYNTHLEDVLPVIMYGIMGSYM